MLISKIVINQKNKSRYSVFADNKYAFSLSKDQLAESGLKVGQEISNQQIEDFKNASTFGKLRDQTYRWLTIRWRSTWEIKDYLKRKTTDVKMQKKVFDLLKEQGYVNDNLFAQKWISNRKLLKPMSTYRIKQELIQKRVSKEVVDHQLAKSGLDDLAVVKEIISKKASKYPDRQKLIAYLSRQGFSYDVIKQALADLNF